MTKQKEDIDGGYAWVVLTGSAVCFCLFGSTIRGFGVFFNGIIEEFDAPSWVISVIPGVLQITCSIFTLPALTIGLRYFSTRQFCICTGILSSGAFILGSLASSVYILIFTQGVMAGMGLAFCHGPLTYLNGVYFIKRRNLAQAVTFAGFSSGGLIFPPIYSYLIETYGLRGGMLITGGIQLHIIVFALLLRPKSPKPEQNGVTNHVVNESEKEKLCVENDIKYKLENGKIKLVNMPLIYVERERSYSESLKYKERKPSVHEPKMNFTSVQNLGCQHHGGSMSKFVDKLSMSNIARLLGDSDTTSMSMTQLNADCIKSVSVETLEYEEQETCNDKMKTVVDCSVFRHWFMWVYFFVYCLGRIANSYFMQFIAPFARDEGIETGKIAILVSLVNGGDFLGRVVTGIITDRGILKTHQTLILTIFVAAISLSLAPYYTKYWHFVLLSLIAGAFAGGVFAMTPSVVADFLGLDNFKSAMGILILGQGFTLGVSGPLIGYLRDATYNYVASFYFMAVCEFLAFFIFVMGLLIKQRSLK